MDNERINYLNQRTLDLMLPIQKQILMCDNTEDLLMMCFAMLNTTKNILEQHYGEEFRKKHFSEFS